MKLYNRTKCPDKILRPLLVAAGRAVGACTGEVVVKVTTGRSIHPQACATEADLVSDRWLTGKPRRDHENWIPTAGGYITMSIPRLPAWVRRAFQQKPPSPRNCAIDWLGQAESFFRTAMHEWAHICDYQTGGRYAYTFSRKGVSGRRPNWSKRPEEIRAQDMVDEAQQKIERSKLSRPDEHILNLAVWLEENKGY